MKKLINTNSGHRLYQFLITSRIRGGFLNSAVQSDVGNVWASDLEHAEAWVAQKAQDDFGKTNIGIHSQVFPFEVPDDFVMIPVDAQWRTDQEESESWRKG